jgi:transcription termination factor NusB
MMDPVGGGLGKAAQQMMQQVQQQSMQQQQQMNVQQQPGMEGKFDKMMTQQVNQTHQVQDVQKTQETTKAVDTLRVAKAQQVDPSTQVKPIEASQEAKKPDGLKRVISGVMDGQSKLDQIISKASSGKQFSNQELLAMQAGVYKFSQELELTSKVVEKATSGIKQTMQTQV